MCLGAISQKTHLNKLNDIVLQNKFFWFCFKQEALVKYIAFNGSPITNPWCTAFLWPPKTLDIEKVEQCGVYNRHSNTGQADTRIPGTSVYWAFCVRYSDAVNELNI